MMTRQRMDAARLIACCCGVVVALAAGRAAAQCVATDNGSGTVTLPPAGCAYLSPTEFHMIVDGLPPGTTIELGPIHQEFFCRGGQQPGCSLILAPFTCEGNGGTLGGNLDCFDSQGQFQMQGTGALSGFNRNVSMPIFCEVHTAPRLQGQPVQSFDTQMFRMQGQLPPGDPDFDLLRITAGQNFGLPSPGHTTLTQLPGNNWAVDSFFDITYRIDFIGAPGGPLAGMSGSTTGTIRMEAGAPPGPNVIACCLPSGLCVETNGASECLSLGGSPQSPGTNCNTVSCAPPNEACCLPGPTCINMLPGECFAQGGTPQGPGTNCDEIFCAPPVQACCYPSGACIETDPPSCLGSGGNPQGPGVTCANVICPVVPTEACCYEEGGCQDNTPDFCIATGGTPQGPGTSCETTGCGPQCAPNSDGSACLGVVCPQDTDICIPTCVRYDPETGTTTILQCECRDPNTCHATVKPGGGGDDGGGAPRGGGNPNPCVVPDAGGTVVLPAPNCPYIAPDDFHMIINGLPPGTTIVVGVEHTNIICRGDQSGTPSVCTFTPPIPNVDCEEPGGSLGGDRECSESSLVLNMNGTGALAGFNRAINMMGVTFETHIGPRTVGDPIQSFDTDMFRLQGQLPPGDPDFDLLRITAGTDFGLPSPGHTTLTRLGPPGSNWSVDSFFDITYRIDFVGAAGGPLAGMSGSTTGTIRMTAGHGAGCEGGCPPGQICDETRFVDPNGQIIICCNCIDAPPSCTPTPTGDGCQPTECPNSSEICLPTCINYDPNTGQSTVISCDCRSEAECHAVLPSGAPGGEDGDVTPHGGGNPCVVTDNGGGTVTLPPIGCAYLSPDDVHMIVDGLPPGTTIELAPIHKDFICNEQPGATVCSFPPLITCEQNGGSLGGNQDCFSSNGQFAAQGTGALAGFNRPILIPLSCEVHSAPRVPGNPVQSFDTDMFRMFGQITGDPDFDLLRIVGGTDFGLPSPGHTTLTQLPGGNWAVDSFFDITYRIDFVGAPGGPLAGMSGSTTGTVRMVTGSAPSCVGNCPPGTQCREVRTTLPNGSIDVCCICEPIVCEPTPNGDGCVPVACPVSGQVCLPTCVKFDPSTGQTTVLSCDCRPENECHAVLFGGAPIGDGEVSPHGGGNPCVVTDNGGGTVTLPPAGCEYLSPDEVHMIIDGLPPGTTIELAPIHRDFICHEQPGGPSVCSFPPLVTCEQSGGSLGGNQDCFDSNGAFALNGTGTLAGFNRTINIPLSCEVHSAPRVPGNPVQSFDTDMFRMFGQITGDPDFDLLRIVGGTDFGLPSPGHTTLTQLPGGNWAVDSFFDITYRIDFVGAPGGPLAGMSGSTTGTIRMVTGGGPGCAGACPPGTLCREVRTVNADGTIDLCCVCEPVECGPTPNGDGCNPAVCPEEGQVCLPTCVNYDPETGQSRVLSCECKLDTECHAILAGGPDGDGDGEVTPHGGGNPCVVADAGGTVVLPPAGCAYLSPDDVHMILDGLPAGTTIQLAPIHQNFVCGGPAGQQGVCHTLLPPAVCEDVGGSLGGNFDCFESDAQFAAQGTGTLAGFNRIINVALSCEVETAPRTPGNPVQSFDTQMFRMFGQITGDPDFDLLRIVGGTDFGLPSPGHTTLTQLPGGNWAVDSFFDITYRIDFVGAPGGPLAGMSGSTTATIRMATGQGPSCVGACPPGTSCREVRTVLPNGSIDVCCVCEAVCHCTGDVYVDGVLNGKDIQAFVDCLLGVAVPSPLINCTCVDFDGNGPSLSDVLPFVQAILNKSPCGPVP